MSLLHEIQNYKPFNEQEAADQAAMLQYMRENSNYLERANQIAHFSTSIWTVNKERTKTLLVYHNIFNSWSWVGGHADGVEDLRSVALRELQEETGVVNATIISPEIVLTVSKEPWMVERVYKKLIEKCRQTI